jgi:uncharacterized protein YndB with AHSA1/START domain
MLKKIGIGVAAALLVLVVVIATRPSTFRIERSTKIAASPDAIFALINDFRAWQGWSPWEKLDPAMKKTHSGAPSGTGAVYSWAGNDEVGEGRMTITNSSPPKRVEIKLEFLKPWEATNTTLFTVEPGEGGSNVTWAMEGKNNFASKAFGLFMDMDAMVGKDFEKGLGAMKALAEATK